LGRAIHGLGTGNITVTNAETLTSAEPGTPQVAVGET
jgi:hypothetical protein